MIQTVKIVLTKKQPKMTPNCNQINNNKVFYEHWSYHKDNQIHIQFQGNILRMTLKGRSKI